jgi:signal transduction histidine kinase/response regulator RpfG family c-di-GMP phosphodiesterase
MNNQIRDSLRQFGESNQVLSSLDSSPISGTGTWGANRVFGVITHSVNQSFGWIGIRGKLLLLILGVIASVACLGWMAVGSTLDFFESREKVDLKDESSITRMRLELMLAETEIYLKSEINGLPSRSTSNTDEIENAESTEALQMETASLLNSYEKDLEIPVPIGYFFSSDGRNDWQDRSSNFGLKKSKDRDAQKSDTQWIRPELKKRFADRNDFGTGSINSQSIWSGVYWESQVAKMQLLIPTENNVAKEGKGYWLILLDCSKSLEKNLARSPREYTFLVNPGIKKELSYSPFGEPAKLAYRKRGAKTGSARVDLTDSIVLKSGKELKNAIDAYEEQCGVDDIETAASTRRAGLEYPLELKEGANGSTLTLADFLASEVDLSFLKTAWYCSTKTISPEVTRELNNQKILEPMDLLASPYDPMKRMSETTGQVRSISIRAGSKEELVRLQNRVSSRLFDLVGKQVDLSWKTAKAMDGLVVNVSQVSGTRGRPTDEPVLYFVRAVALTEIRQSAYESLSQYQNWALFLAIVAMIVVILLAIYIAQPLVKMTNTVNQISKVGITDAIGSDKIRKLLDELPVDKHGEVGSLAKQFQKTFHEMLDQLRFKELAEKEGSVKAEEANRAKLKEKDAVEESQAKSQFLAMISHDMRQPLHMIFTELQLMMKQSLTDLQATKANAILTSARRLKNLIQDILDYQRYMANDLAVERIEVSVQDMLKGIAEQFSHQARDTQNELKVVCGFDRTIFTDQPKLERILVNLLSNAFKFTEMGTITLQADLLRGNLIQFTVSDTGRGISEDQKAKIFSIQRTANQKGNPGGTGLGLYICSLLVQHMKGDIQFESKLGAGTTFTITIPTDFQNAIAARPQKPNTIDPSASEDKSITVLIIDDQPESRRSIRESLPAGYRWIEASSGEEGLRLAVEHVPDAITLDVEMPEMDGWMVLAELQKNEVTQGIPVVMVTVHPTQNKATILGANGFISKPFDPIELSTMIRRTLIERADGTVMIVDDDAATRRDLKQYLESSGWKVIAAVDGEDAMNKLQDNVPSLFIVDLYMPNMDGFALIEKLRTMPDTSHTPIVVLSAAYLSPEQKRFLQPRIQQYFAKGTSDLNAIQEEIERLVAHHGYVQSASET